MLAPPYDWTRRLIALKLKPQARLLHQAQRRRPDQRRPLVQSEKSILALAKEARDAANPEQLLGLEGAGAAAYFRAYACLLPAELGFSGRKRQPGEPCRPLQPTGPAPRLARTLR
jgi:CRISPR-associated protein Cas1